MTYHNVIPGTFIHRPNRFIAEVEINGRQETVHVKNTGRCRELLIPGSRVYLEASDNPNRKTAYDLIAVEKERPGASPLLINMDSQAPNHAVGEWLPKSGLFLGNALIRREVTYGSSRFDFCIDDNHTRSFLEVKGVTLEQNGLALFPDAPTERGVKHLHELIHCIRHGYSAYVLFVVQMKGIHRFSPNDSTHRAFGDALRLASQAGVTLLARDCITTADSMTIDAPIPIEL